MEREGDLLRFTEGRLDSAPSALFQELITRPEILPLREPGRFTAELTVDLAHTVMLAECGIISQTDAAAICRALNRALEAGPDSIRLDASRDSSLFQIEAYLAGEIGHDASGRMHTGRSRTDRGAAVMRLQLRDHLRGVLSALHAWQEALIAKGEEHCDTVLPGYTHLQAAQPITFGHHLLAQFWLHAEDVDRLQLAYRHINLNALGTASIAGTSWPLDRERTRELLGFDALTQNARVSRTYIFRAEAASAYATLLATLHYLTSDLYVWFSEEFGMVEPADQHSGSSSIMPQKKNPYVWERTRVTARHASGWTASALAALMGATSSDSFLEPPEVETYGPLIEGLLRINTEALQHLGVDRDRMLNAARRSFATANHLADLLVRERGMPFREAHSIVGRLVRMCVERGLAPMDVDSGLLDRAAEEVGAAPPSLEPDVVREALDPVSFVNSRVTLGGASPKDVRRQIGAARRLLESHRAWLTDVDAQVDESREALRRAVAAIVR